MSPGEVWLIANPTAGGGRGTRHASVVTRMLHDAQIPCRLLQPGSALATTQASLEAVSSGAKAVVACGGDGTVNAVLQALVRGGAPLGIVAAGSGDDIANCLGFPVRDPEASGHFIVEAVRSGAEHPVDVGRATTADGTERHFVGVLSSGFDSAVNERANSMTRLAGQRYNVAIVRELASFRPVPYRMTIDDVLHEADGMLVAVGNGSRYGGGMRVCPDALPDDGMLDITWLQAVSKLTFLRAFPSVYRGDHVNRPFVKTFRGRSVTIDAPGQIAYADGERIGPLPVAIELQAGVVRVLGGAAMHRP